SLLSIDRPSVWSPQIHTHASGVRSIPAIPRRLLRTPPSPPNAHDAGGGKISITIDGRISSMTMGKRTTNDRYVAAGAEAHGAKAGKRSRASVTGARCPARA